MPHFWRLGGLAADVIFMCDRPELGNPARTLLTLRQPKRIPELDGVRGIAVALVLIWHYGVCQAKFAPDSWVTSLSSTLALTWSGVDLFFVLSGFLIVGILVDSKDTPHYFRAFFVRRACRILPVYYVILLLFIPFSRLDISTHTWLFDEKLPFWSYFLFLQNFFMHRVGFGPNWMGVTWSLAIEEQFYLLIPFFVRFFSRKWLVLTFVAMIVISPLARFLLGYWGNYTLPFARADSIAAGALLALLVRNVRVMDWLTRHRHLVVGVAAVLCLGLIPITVWKWGLGHPWGHLWLAAIYSGILLSAYVCRGGLLSLMLSGHCLRWLGTRSYALYLFHQPVAGVVYGALGYNRPKFSSLAESGIMFLCLGLVFLLAEFSMWVIERPAQKLSHRVTYA